MLSWLRREATRRWVDPLASTIALGRRRVQAGQSCSQKLVCARRNSSQRLVFAHHVRLSEMCERVKAGAEMTFPARFRNCIRVATLRLQPRRVARR